MAFTAGLPVMEVTGPDFEGRVTVRHGEHKPMVLHFSWGAIQQMQTEYGEEFLQTVSMGLDRKDITVLSHVLSYASGLGEGEIRSRNYPIMPLCAAALRAWEYAWNGGEIAEDDEEDDEAPEKRTARVTLWQRLSKAVSVLVSRGPISGS